MKRSNLLSSHLSTKMRLKKEACSGICGWVGHRNVNESNLTYCMCLILAILESVQAIFQRDRDLLLQLWSHCWDCLCFFKLCVVVMLLLLCVCVCLQFFFLIFYSPLARTQSSPDWWLVLNLTTLWDSSAVSLKGRRLAVAHPLISWNTASIPCLLTLKASDCLLLRLELICIKRFSNPRRWLQHFSPASFTEAMICKW